MILMGVDQSLTSTGITIWDGEKYHWLTLSTVKTKGTKSPTIDYTRRLMDLSQDVGELIKEYGVEMVAIEGMSFSSTGRIVFDLGGLSHLLRAKFIELDTPFVVIPPTTLKKFWFGKGNAKKDDMIQAAIDRGYDIPITKNYGTKKNPDIKMDDNVVDSHALCIFIQELEANKLNPEFLDVVEYSKNVVFTR